MARILLGVCGSVSAYKSLELVRQFVKKGHSVRVTQTQSSLKFVGKASFEAVTGAPVLVGQFENDPMRGSFPGDELPIHSPIAHIELVERADVFIIAPATASTIAKIACGISDSLLTDAYLACKVPVVLAPAMNSAMWEHEATQHNLSVLRQRGDTIVNPDTGDLASKGEWGVGRLPKTSFLLQVVEEAARKSSGGAMSDMNVLITAGGTKEPIDAVRYLGNRSSGRMGFALAEEAKKRGAKVTVLEANVDLPRCNGVSYLKTETADKMHRRAVEELPNVDIVLMTAAVADFRPDSTEAGKISKDRGDFDLKLTGTIDIVSDLSRRRNSRQILVGFAAEHGEGGLDRAKNKLKAKGLDMIIYNDVSRDDIGFDTVDNEVTLIDCGGVTELGKMSKTEIASRILDRLNKFMDEA